MSIIFDTTVSGIPCQCEVTDYSPAKDWVQHTFPGAGPGDCTIPEDEEFEFNILDRKGYRAHWLEKKLTSDDEDRLLEEFKEQR